MCTLLRKLVKMRVISNFVRVDRMNKQHYLLDRSAKDSYVCTLCGKQVSLHESWSREGANLICDVCYEKLGANAAEIYLNRY